MKKTAMGILMAALSISGAAAWGESLRTFGSLCAALREGGRVRAVFEYKVMTLTIDGKVEAKVPDAVGGMELGAFEYFAAGAVGNAEAFLSASQAVLIRHPRYGVVLNYVKVSVTASNKVKILAQYMDPRTYKVRMDETFTTTIADGANGGGAFFYRLE